MDRSPKKFNTFAAFDFTGGQRNKAVLFAAIDRADQRLGSQFGGTEAASYTRVRPSREGTRAHWWGRPLPDHAARGADGASHDAVAHSCQSARSRSG
jgi:hypothetical protein